MRPPLKEVDPNNPKRFPTMSGRDYLTLLETVPAVTYRCLPVVTWPMIFISDEITALTGWPAEDFIGLEPKRSYISIIFPEDQQMVSDVIFEAVNQRRPYTIEYRVVTSAGQLRWVFERGVAVLEENGNAAYLDGTILDVTTRKNTELELAKYRGHLEEMVAKRTASLEAEVEAHRLTEQALDEKSRDLDDFFCRSIDALVITDITGLIRRASPSMVQALGLTLEDVTGHLSREFIHADDQPKTRRILEEVFKRGGSCQMSFRIRHRNGSYRHFEWIAYVDGQLLYAVGRDVTERLASEQALRDSEEQLRIVFQCSPVGMAVLRRPDMVCVDVNEAILEAIGRSREECLGKTPMDINFFISQKDLDDAVEIFRLGLAKANEPMEFRNADGSITEITLNCEPFSTSRGEFILIYFIPQR